VATGSEAHKPEISSSNICCTYYVSPFGSDEKPGTLAEPWKTLQKAFDTATAGQTVCLRGGIYPQYVDASAGFNQVEKRSGAPEKPILFTNFPGEIAEIHGSTKIYGSYISFRGLPNGTRYCSAMHPCGLIFEGSRGYVLNAISIMNSSGPGHVTFDHVEIRKGITMQGSIRKAATIPSRAAMSTRTASRTAMKTMVSIGQKRLRTAGMAA